LHAKPYVSIEEILNEIQDTSQPGETIISMLKEIARQYREKIRQELETRKYRDWYQHTLIPFSLEKVHWDETRLGFESTGDIDDLNEALKQQPQWIIMGEAGIGKTTLLEKFLIDSQDSFPILIKTTNNTEDPVEAIQNALMAVQLSISEEEITQGLKLKMFSILVDGLEERDSEKRNQIVKLCSTTVLKNIPVLVAVRETVYLNFPGDQRFPGHFKMLRLLPITSLKIHGYLNKRLSYAQGRKACKAIAEKGMTEIFRTPLILDMWLKYGASRGFPIPNSKMEILDHFFDAFFDEWEIPKIHKHHPSFIKKHVLLRLAQFLFEKKEYLVRRGEFEQFFYQTWNKIFEEYTGIGDPDSAFEVLIHHGLITPKGYYMGFAVPLYRDYFLIKGMEKTTLTSQEKQQLAEICIELNFDLKAKELYTEMGFDSDSYSTTKIAAAKFFRKHRELGKAAEIITSILPSRNPKPYQIYALILKDIGRYKESERQFKEGIAVDPKNASLYQAYSLMLMELGQYLEAEEQLKKGIKFDQNALLYQAYALMLKEMGQYPEAEKQFKKGIEVDPKNAPLYQAYALMLKEMGRFEDAALQMEHVLEIDPNIRNKITFLNILFYCLNRINEAEFLVYQILQNEKIEENAKRNLKLTQKLIQWRKDYLAGESEATKEYENFYQYSKGLIRNNNFEAAVKALKELCIKQPLDFKIHHNLGRALISQGDFEGIRFLEKSLELNPEPTLEILSKIFYSAIDAEHYDWVQIQLNPLLQKEPKNTELLRLQARLLAYKGHDEKAREIYEKAYSLAETTKMQARILRGQARMLRDQDHFEAWKQAEILLEKAWALEPQNPGTFNMRQEIRMKMNQPFEKKNIYQLIKERLEPGDIIEVKLQRFNKNQDIQCFYYGVPGNLPWHEIAETYEPFDTLQAVFSRLNEKGELNLEWSESILQNNKRKRHIEKIKFYQTQKELIKKSNIHVNQAVKAQIKDLKPFGITVQFQGFLGFIHRYNIAESINYHWKTFPLQEGDYLNAKIIDIQEDGKIQLALEELPGTSSSEKNPSN
jgi:tetratricopeptide (TPR) repeat protein